MRFLSKERFDVHMKEVLVGTGVTFVMVIIGESLKFGFNLLLANTLGPAGAGQFFLALTVITLATVLGQIGLDKALLKFIAANAALDNWVAVKGLYLKGTIITVCSSTLSLLTVFAAAPFISSAVFGNPELTVPLRWMSIAILPMALMMQHAEMLKGLKKMREAHLVNKAMVPFCSLIALYFLHEEHGIMGAVWAYSAAAVLALAAGRFFWVKNTPQLKKAIGKFSSRELLASSIPLFWISFLDILIQWMGILILGIFGTEKDVGIFTIASNTALVIVIFLFSVNSITAPKYAALYSQKEFAALGGIARNSTMLMTLLSSPFLMVFLFFPSWVMSFYGSGFEQGAILLSVLAVGQFVNVATGSVGLLLIMSGHERQMMNVIFFIAVLNITANLVLVPIAGPFGAAFAASICVITKNIVLAILVWQKLGIITIPFPKVE